MLLTDNALVTGHPKADLTMTELFGGFAAKFVSPIGIAVTCYRSTRSVGTFTIFTTC